MNELENKENKKEYELAYLLSSEVAEEKLELEIAELKRIISENNGETLELETPKKRWLAYPVKKQGQAYFGVIYFNTEKENLAEIKKILSFNKNVLRFLILNKTFKKPKPKAAPVKLSDEPTPTQSFDKKLESILNG